MVKPEGEGSTGLYQYFIKVVPTIYTDESRRILSTNQYTFTERFRPLMLPDSSTGLLTAVSYPHFHFYLVFIFISFYFLFFPQILFETGLYYLLSSRSILLLYFLFLLFLLMV